MFFPQATGGSEMSEKLGAVAVTWSHDYRRLPNTPSPHHKYRKAVKSGIDPPLFVHLY